MLHRSLSIPILSITLALAAAACTTSSAPEELGATSHALTTCSSNCDCPYSTVCTNGVCTPDFGPFPPCYCAARDCDPGEGCVNGFCTAGPTSCTSDCDCPYGSVCTNGSCTADFGPFPPCYCAARDCGFGESCVNGFCTSDGGGSSPIEP